MRFLEPKAFPEARVRIARQWLAATFSFVSICCFSVLPALAAPRDQPYSSSARSRARAELPPRGMIIYKRHVQADELAPFVEYSRLKVVANQAIDLIRHDGGGMFSIPMQQLVYHIVYPQETDELMTDTQFERISARLGKLRTLARRFQKSATPLEPWIARLEHEVTMWESGFCRVNGQWVNRVSFHYDQKVAELRQAFAERRKEILGSPAAESDEPDDVAAAGEDSPIPPMWTLDLEQQLREEEAAEREAKKKEAERARQERSKKFNEKIEEERPFRTGWRIKA